MDPKYGPFLPSTLAAFGAALQFARANRIPDRIVGIIGFALGIGGWALCVDWTKAAADPRLFALEQVLILPGCIASVFGGTYVASKGATALVAAGAPADHPFVPVTNNKGTVQ